MLFFHTTAHALLFYTKTDGGLAPERGPAACKLQSKGKQCKHG